MDRFYAMFNICEKAKQDFRYESLNNAILSHPHFSNMKYTTTNKCTLAKTMYNGHNFWLIKPPDFNRGRGVQVFNNVDQLKRLIQDYQ